MDAQLIIQLLSDLGFPIVLVVAIIYFGGKYAVPKVVAMIENLISDFRDEMEKERMFHAKNLDRFFDAKSQGQREIIDKIERARDDVVDVVKEVASKKGGV